MTAKLLKLYKIGVTLSIIMTWFKPFFGIWYHKAELGLWVSTFSDRNQLMINTFPSSEWVENAYKEIGMLIWIINYSFLNLNLKSFLHENPPLVIPTKGLNQQKTFSLSKRCLNKIMLKDCSFTMFLSENEVYLFKKWFFNR